MYKKLYFSERVDGKIVNQINATYINYFYKYLLYYVFHETHNLQYLDSNKSKIMCVTKF